MLSLDEETSRHWLLNFLAELCVKRARGEAMRRNLSDISPVLTVRDLSNYYYYVKYILTLRTGWCRLGRHECTSIGRLRGTAARVPDHHVGRGGARRAPSSRRALCARPAAGWRTKIDRTAGWARARRQYASPATIRRAKSVGVGAGAPAVGATHGARVAAGGGLDRR